jgi:hypothetical protein
MQVSPMLTHVHVHIKERSDLHYPKAVVIGGDDAKETTDQMRQTTRFVDFYTHWIARSAPSSSPQLLQATHSHVKVEHGFPRERTLLLLDKTMDPVSRWQLTVQNSDHAAIHITRRVDNGDDEQSCFTSDAENLCVKWDGTPLDVWVHPRLKRNFSVDVRRLLPNELKDVSVLETINQQGLNLTPAQQGLQVGDVVWFGSSHHANFIVNVGADMLVRDLLACIQEHVPHWRSGLAIRYGLNNLSEFDNSAGHLKVSQLGLENGQVLEVLEKTPARYSDLGAPILTPCQLVCWNGKRWQSEEEEKVKQKHFDVLTHGSQVSVWGLDV